MHDEQMREDVLAILWRVHAHQDTPHEYWCNTCGIGIETFADWQANDGECGSCQDWWAANSPDSAAAIRALTMENNND
jgi:hypothetical protein